MAKEIGREDQRRESKIMGALKTGAMIGAGYGIYRNRAVIGRQMGRMTNNLIAPGVERAGLNLQNGQPLHNAMTRMGMYYRATTSIIGDSPSGISVVKSFLQANSPQGRARFNNSIQTQLQQRLRQERGYGETSSAAMNAVLNDLYDPRQLGKGQGFEFRANYRGKQQKVRDVSREAILNNADLHANLPLGVNPQQLEQLMSEYNSRHRKKFDLFPVLDTGNLGKSVDDFVKKADEQLGGLRFNNDQHRRDFEQKLFNTLDGIQRHKLDAGEHIARQEQLGVIQILSQSREKSKFFDNKMKYQGYRELTFGDALNMTPEERRAAGLTTHTVTGALKNNATSKLQKEINEIDPVKIFQDIYANAITDPHFARLVQQEHGTLDITKMRMGAGLFVKDGRVADISNLIKGSEDLLHGFQETFRIPFLGFNPLDLTPLATMKAARTAEGVRRISQGSFQTFLQGSRAEFYNKTLDTQQSGTVLKPFAEDVFYAGNKVWKSTDDGLQAIDDRKGYLIPNYGPHSRAGLNMGNLTGIKEPDNRNLLQRAFGLGRQEQDGYFTQWGKSLNKGNTPEYAPSTLGILRSEIQAHPTIDSEQRVQLVRDRFENLYDALFSNTRSLESETIEALAPHVNRHFSGLMVGVGPNKTPFDLRKLQDDNYLIDVALSIANAPSEVLNRRTGTQASQLILDTARGGYKYDHGQLVPDIVHSQVRLDPLVKGVYTHPLTKEIYDYVDELAQNPQVFLQATRQAPQRQMDTPLKMVMPFVGEEHLLIPRTEDLRRSVHQFIIESYDQAATPGRDLSSILRSAQFTEPISAKDIENFEKLKVFNNLKGYQPRLFGSRESSIAEAQTFAEDLFGPNLDTLTQKGQQYQRVAENTHRWYERAPEPSEQDLLGDGIMFIPEGGVINSVKQSLSDINDATRIMTTQVDPLGVLGKGGSAIANGANVFRELFAGRKSLDRVTDTTLNMYYLADRLNNAVSLPHLGLPRELMGSFTSVIANQFGRRVVLPYVAYQQMMWADGMLGDAPSDSLADGYVGGHQLLNTMKELTMINKIMEPISSVMGQTGFDQVKDWVGVQPFNFATMGLFSDFRSGEEVRQYYESGEDPVRKSRYWGLGSTTPWSGGRIDHYEPNWYRKMKSDYKFTDTMYGSESEYWANHWMPTLTHPFAPLKHFIFDSKHYENKHEKDRPAAYTGGFNELEMIPIIGGAVDKVASSILKPREAHKGLEKAHREYIKAYNEMLQTRAGGSEDGTLVTVGAAGTISTYNLYGNQGLGDGYGLGQGAIIGGEQYGGLDTGPEGLNGPYPTGNGVTYGADVGRTETGIFNPERPVQTVHGHTKLEMASANAKLALNAKAQKTMSPQQIQGLANPYDMPMGDVRNMDSVGQALNSMFYSASELGGIYGFGLKTGLNYEESIFDLSWQTSSGMSSYRRSFWDQNLGGMGGSLSEIGRRYIPRDIQKNAYSPIRNTMPEWLPGMENYTDFLHGDPYTKIQKGEMRLPGKAYETLYRLHPDGTGGTGEWANYGTFDRFRILADVAPSSQQYQIVKSQVSAMRAEGLFDEEMEREYQQVKEQVQEKKKKHRWYNRKFGEADLIKDEVTVTRVLDANTFLTREYGESTPIRLAGVSLSQDDTDAVAWLQQFIKTGAKLKVGLNKDPMNRMNSDVMGTMSAVVYAPHNEEENGGVLFSSTHSIKGQSLNALLANRNWANSDVRIKDNGTAAATQALYSSTMITVGSMMESLTHDILPNIPLVGILADKFLQTRSPVESYIRDQVYNKEWKEWTNPISDWIIPMTQTIGTRNPLLAGAQMGAIGGLFFKPKPGVVSAKGKYIGILGGFFTGAMLASVRSIYEASSVAIGNDKVLIPERKLKERDLDQYFDRLQYVKYRGLYEKAKDLAIEKEGVDPDLFADAAKQKGIFNKNRRKELKENKKWLSIFQKRGYDDLDEDDTNVIDSARQDLKSINKELNEIDDDKQVYQAGRYTALALQYKKAYESTLYGADPQFANMQDIFAAMNPVDREYIPEILKTATPRERQKILKVVSPDIKRILQAKWGLKVDQQESVEEYFRDRPLPGPNWEGWNANVSLEDIKIKVMKKQGMELKSAGYWADDEKRAELSGVKPIQTSTVLPSFDTDKLMEVLRGKGLEDVDVTMNITYSDDPSSFQTHIDFKKDIRESIISGMNEFKSGIFA
jgi:hypothetical protein